MWDPDVIDAYVMQDNLEHSQTFVHESALQASIRELRWAQETPGQPVAGIPRGFGFMFDGEYVDHNLLQAAFDLDEVQRVLIGRPDRIAWNASTILKDDGEQSFLGAAMISVVGGSGVQVHRDDTFDLQPRSSTRFCGHLGGSTHTQEVIVPNLPYDYVAPVLAGWDIAYPCGDHHVKDIGTRIAEFSYDKAQGASTGTLRYKVISVLRDQNADDGLFIDYKVNVLGFNLGFNKN